MTKALQEIRSYSTRGVLNTVGAKRCVYILHYIKLSPAQPWVVAISALQRATLPCTARCRSLLVWCMHRSGSLSLASAPPLARRSLSSGARSPLRVAGAPWCSQAVRGACLPAPLNAPLTSLSLGSSYCITGVTLASLGKDLRSSASPAVRSSLTLRVD